MPSDHDTLGDLTGPPRAITIILEHQTCVFHCDFFPFESPRLKVTLEPKEAGPEMTDMAASGIQALREAPLVRGGLGD